MPEDLLFDSMRRGLLVSVQISSPILVVALVAGLAIGLFQALTSVQEMTLTFVPKLAAIGAVFWVTMGYMTETLVSFFKTDLIPMITGL
jgi:flagellar biosynthetic protein FliQ